MNKSLTKLIGLLALTTVVSSCSGDQAAEQATIERTIAVKTQLVGLSNRQIIKTYTGSLEGEKQAVLYSKVAEAVEKVNVKEGQVATAGMVLISLDRTGPSSQHQQAKSIYKNSEKNYKKMEYLFKEGAVSESAYDAARTDYEVNKASFEAAEQLVDIRSPIGGVVTSVDVSEGDFVQVGSRLATVATTKKLRVKFGVNAADIGTFEKGAKVHITADGVTGEAIGEVVAIAGSADPVSRTFEVEALIDNKDGLFKPGIFARIEFVERDLTDVVVVPRSSIITLEGQDCVYIVSGGKAVRRTLTLGTSIGDEILVESGLVVGDTLVTLGQDYLDEGFAVNVTGLSEAH